MASKNKYWTGLEELKNTEAFEEKANNEFPAEMSVDEFLGNSSLSESTTGRRDFLKFLGFSVTAATVAACETPVIKSIPYVNKPEDITPGVANYYASTYVNGADFASVLVKTREGRPIYIKGNKQFGLNKGGVNARINSSVLSLYNTARVQQPTIKGEESTWKAVDNYVLAGLNKVRENGGKVAYVSSSVFSPSKKAAVASLENSLPEDSFTHVVYEPISYSAMRSAHKAAYGEAILPSYNLEKALTIVSVNADFLNSWLMPTVLTAQYLTNRKPDNGTMSRHFHFEAVMSLTGSNADVRIGTKPSEEGAVLLAIYNHIAGKAGVATVGNAGADWMAKTKKAAADLWSNRGESVVLAGMNDLGAQQLALAINQLLGNYGETVLENKAVNLHQYNEEAFGAFLNEAKNGAYDVVILDGVNPNYSYNNTLAVSAALAKVKTSVAIGEYADETGTLCGAIAPDCNWLESWNDYSAIAGEYALGQPTISNLYNTRQGLESLLTWAGAVNTSALDFIKATCEKEVFANVSEDLFFGDFWNQTVHNGSTSFKTSSSLETYAVDLSSAAKAVSSMQKTAGEGMQLALYQKMGIAAGSDAANPWLQELPDPITKVTWDNYLTVSPADAETLGFEAVVGQETPASVAKLNVNGQDLNLPVYVLPGQVAGTVGLALGYGRGANGENIGKAAFQTGEYGGYLTDESGNNKAIGTNGFALATSVGNHTVMAALNVTVESTEETYALACTQTHHTIMGRTSIIRETSLVNFNSADKEDYNPAHTLQIHEGHEVVDKPISEVDLWAEHPVEDIGHRWGMSIDLNLCIGCGSCITACHSENNVPVVGKDEIRRSRDMHWMRIDRYFSSAEDVKKHNGEDFEYGLMEVPEEKPQVVHMPMMCQHCNHAPCETVCPVAATTHSNEGLNQMTYNRCIGTRYCANNCPYKVRRFNWFNYQAYKKFTEVNPAQDDMSRMVLNPDVAVRSRGVMEKCSLCVQRIQEGKLVAKKASRAVQDGDIQSACSESCPTNAITFGDLNDKKSAIAISSKSKRAYQAIEEVGTRPNVYYQVKVRNVEENTEA